MIVNGFEIIQLPNGYVDCLSYSGSVMSTHNNTSDAVAWANGDEAPTLDTRAIGELASLGATCGYSDTNDYFVQHTVDHRQLKRWIAKDKVSTSWNVSSAKVA